mmetsp:Transcript_3726/g.12522  ORF Transcript_3726/g.12522 Transcript_3726/m.12522 type:complete len:213 (-) Transcript_3726:3882-4520(-)
MRRGAMRALLWQCSSCSYSRRRSVDSSGEQARESASRGCSESRRHTRPTRVSLAPHQRRRLGCRTRRERRRERRHERRRWQRRRRSRRRRRSTTGRHRPQSRPLRAVQGSALKTMLELGRTLRLGSTTGRAVRGWRCARPRCAMQQRPRSSPPLLSRAWEVTMLERRARPPLPRRAWRGLSHRPRTGAAACALAASGAAATPTTCSKCGNLP